MLEQDFMKVEHSYYRQHLHIEHYTKMEYH